MLYSGHVTSATALMKLIKNNHMRMNKRVYCEIIHEQTNEFIMVQIQTHKTKRIKLTHQDIRFFDYEMRLIKRG